MTTKKDLQGWVIESLQGMGGEGDVADIAKGIWERHETELRLSGKLIKLPRSWVLK